MDGRDSIEELQGINPSFRDRSMLKQNMKTHLLGRIHFPRHAPPFLLLVTRRRQRMFCIHVGAARLGWKAKLQEVIVQSLVGGALGGMRILMRIQMDV
jgi:hypothetical protein